jgi:hypothetical protein
MTKNLIMKKIISFSSILFLIIQGCGNQENVSQIEGSWKMTEFSFNSPDTSWTIEAPQPGLFIFEKDYCSMMYVAGNEPRPLFPDGYSRNTITDEQIRSTFMNFFAASGKYVLSDSKFSFTPSVALEPNYMTGGSSEYEYIIKNDTLWLTRNVSNGNRHYKFVRLDH